MKYFEVSFQYSENVYCSNLVRASRLSEAVEAYSGYEWSSVREITERAAASQMERGKPLMEIHAGRKRLIINYK